MLLCLIMSVVIFSIILYIYVVDLHSLSQFVFYIFLDISNPLYISLQNSESNLETFIGYVDGASRSMQNLCSLAWAIFIPNGEVVICQEICIGRSTKISLSIAR